MRTEITDADVKAIDDMVDKCIEQEVEVQEDHFVEQINAGVPTPGMGLNSSLDDEVAGPAEPEESKEDEEKKDEEYTPGFCRFEYPVGSGTFHVWDIRKSEHLMRIGYPEIQARTLQMWLEEDDKKREAEEKAEVARVMANLNAQAKAQLKTQAPTSGRDAARESARMKLAQLRMKRAGEVESAPKGKKRK